MEGQERVRSVLITGATGFFGQAMVQHLLEHDLADRICCFSRDEHKQAAMRRRFKDDGRLRFFVGDCRDKSRLSWAMNGIGLVLHAAALKRIEVGHYNPSEMVLTNVIGTMNVIEAAQRAPILPMPYPRRVVFLSSDKAFEPVSAYGQSKALAESLILGANHTSGAYGPLFSATRYGNICGSTGSVIPKFRELHAAGEPINITDPDCTRFAMTIKQAVELVWNTAENMKGGELVTPILPAFDLRTLLEAMEIKDYNTLGLPAWEKKHESMGPGNSSDKAERLTVDQLRKLLEQV